MPQSLIHSFGLTGKGLVSIVGAGGKTSLMFRLAKVLAKNGKTVLTTTTTRIFIPTQDQSPDTFTATSLDQLVQAAIQRQARYPHFSAGSFLDRDSGKLAGFDPDLIDTLWETSLFDWIIVEADGSRQMPLKASDVHEPVLPKSTTHLILVTGLDAVGEPLDHMHVHRAHLFSQNMDLPLGHPVDARAIAACAAIEIKKAQGLCHPAVTIYCLNKADTDHRIADARAIRMHLAAESNIDSIVTTCLCRESPVIEYVDKKKPASKKISGIILAAGSSTRMGRTKQLLPFKNTTLLGQVMENARAAALHEIIVVLGHDADTISKTLDFSGITVIRNPDYLNGQSTSLVKGIEKVSRASDAAMFLLADQPLVTPGLINRLLEAFNTRPAPIVIPCYQGQRGNPVIIARRLFHQLSALSADTGARALFDRFKDHLLKVSVPDDSILVDVDTPDAYETLLSRISRE